MINASEVRTWMCLEEEATATIKLLIERATATLGRYLGGLYLGAPTTKIELFCPDGSNVLSLDQTPTDGLMAVYTRRDVFDAWVIVDTDDWRLEGWHLFHRSAWPCGRMTVKAEYPVGWTYGTGPQELQQLVKEMVVLGYSQMGVAGTANLQSETLGDYSYTRGDVEALASWQSVVSSWKRLRV